MNRISTTPEQRLQMARFIVDHEARTDKAGHLKVYKLPAADGGGTYEVAGINDRYHPNQAAILSSLIGQGQFEEAMTFAVKYIAGYTDVATNWAQHPAIEAFMRDSVFNRGARGALRILQIALRVEDDGSYGPKTKAANVDAHKKPANLLSALRSAREIYELRIAPPRGERAKFWKGLVNRWDAAFQFSKGFL